MQANILVQAVLFVFLLIIISINDVKYREIPPKLCILVVFLSFLNFKISNLGGLSIAFLLLFIASLNDGKIGGGDIKLCASVSLVLGFFATAYGVILAFIFVSLLSFTRFRHKKVPLAPFLAIGFLTTYLYNLGGLIK